MLLMWGFVKTSCWLVCFRIFDNECFMQDWRSRGDFQIFQYLVMKWLSCFLIGLIMGLVGFFNNLAVENIAGKKFVVTSNMMLEGRYSLHFSSSCVLLLLKIFAIFSICFSGIWLK